MKKKEMLKEIERVQRSVKSFADEMRAKNIHVGMGKDPVCVTCGARWPCQGSRKKSDPKC